VGISAADFKKMLKMNKLKWKCKQCKSPTKQDSREAEKEETEPGSGVLKCLGDIKSEITAMRKSQKCETKNVMEAIGQCTSKIEELAKKCEMYEEQIFSLITRFEKTETKLKECEKENREMKRKINELEQASLDTTVEIEGLPLEEAVDGRPLVESLMKHVGCSEEVLKSIERVIHRPWKQGRLTTVKFTTNTMKIEFLKLKKRKGDVFPEQLGCQTSTRKIYVNEKLTSYNRHLLWLAKTTKGLGYKFVWTRQGRIFVRKDEGSKIYTIRDAADIPTR
jgi:predicted RNase H-like nuclease (RuvC/YqgF family)